MKVIHVLLVAVVLLLGGAECRRSNHAPVVSGPPVGVGIAIQDTSYLFEVAASDENGDRVCCRIDCEGRPGLNSENCIVLTCREVPIARACSA